MSFPGSGAPVVLTGSGAQGMLEGMIRDDCGDGDRARDEGVVKVSLRVR